MHTYTLHFDPFILIFTQIQCIKYVFLLNRPRQIRIRHYHSCKINPYGLTWYNIGKIYIKIFITKLWHVVYAFRLNQPR
jgi:hypothetical protein